VVLGGSIDMGGSGTCKVIKLELEPSTGLVYFTLRSHNGVAKDRQLVLVGEGAGEFADD
jgi:hypothetical protein